MTNTKDDTYYLNKVIDNMKFVIDHTQSISIEEMQNNDILIDSIMFRLIQIAENSIKLTENFKNKFNKVP